MEMLTARAPWYHAGRLTELLIVLLLLGRGQLAVLSTIAGVLGGILIYDRVQIRQSATHHAPIPEAVTVAGL
jgi:hypothetical protein